MKIPDPSPDPRLGRRRVLAGLGAAFALPSLAAPRLAKALRPRLMLAAHAVFLVLFCLSCLVLARTGQAMLLRRRGRVYVASEWQLARLKHRLHFQAALPALYYFALRALPRLLPAGLLGHVYRILRRR